MSESVATADLRPVHLLHGVVLCAEVDGRLIVGNIAGDAALLGDLIDYADERGCAAIVFHTSRKGILVRALDATNARHAWAAPHVIGYWVEIARENT